jgi:hypothetical protein
MQVSIFKCGPARLKIGSQKAYAFSAKLTLTLNLVAAPHMRPVAGSPAPRQGAR